MRSVRVQHHKQRLALALGLAILVLALLGHVNAVDAHHGIVPTWHHHACWILTPELTAPAVLMFVWFVSMFHVTLLREHILLVFKPPRLRPLSINS